MSAREEDIKQHKRIKITEINVLRRLGLTYEECADIGNMRRFCASNDKTLPDMVQIVVTPAPDTSRIYQWKIEVWEQPNLPEDITA